MKHLARALAFALALLPALAGAQIYLPPNVGLPPQTVIGNALSQNGNAVAVSFSQISSAMNVPALKTCSSHQWFSSLTTGGVLGCTQPSLSDISGFGSGVATFLATPTSANLRAALTDETGTGSAVFGTGPTITNANLGTPSTLVLTNATSLPISTGLTGAGTGVLTALGVNVGSAGAFVVNGGALGTPSSGVATNLTGTAAGLTAGTVTTNANLTGAVTSVGNATSLGSFTSANLRGALTDESGTGAAYFQGGDLGTPSAGVGTNLTSLNATQLTSGTVPAGRMPALTGDCTTSAGAVATTCTKTNGVSFATIATSGSASDLGTGTLPTARLSLGQLTNSLGSNVTMNNTANYFDGPSIAQGSTGTWWVSGSVVVGDTSAGAQLFCKLWDGTTIIASDLVNTTGANITQSLHLSGFLATPAGNLRISCRDTTSTNGLILFNGTSNSKDSTISAFRIN